jgi:hypothetical protein
MFILSAAIIHMEDMLSLLQKGLSWPLRIGSLTAK